MNIWSLLSPVHLHSGCSYNADARSARLTSWSDMFLVQVGPLKKEESDFYPSAADCNIDR